MLDREIYSHKTIEIYEIMSAYYIDIFYNHLYSEANKLKINGNVSSITEGYKHTLNAFIKSLANPKLYKKSIVGIHHYFITIGYASISFTKCIDKLIYEFVPTDYFISLSSTQKMGVLRLILNQSLKTFIKKIVDEHMIKIIDNHKERDNVRILQDDLIDCFIMEREGMYQRFISIQTESGNTDHIDRKLLEKMQQEIKKLVKEKYEHKREINILKQAYLLKKQNETLLHTKISELTKQIDYNTKNTDYNTKNTEYTDYNTKNTKNIDYNTKNTKNTEYTDYNTKNTDYSKIDRKVILQTPIVRHEINKPSSYVFSAGNPSTIQCSDNVDTNSEMISDINITDDDGDFLEVTPGNIDQILTADSDYINQIKDSRTFVGFMDDSTTIDDFT